MRSIIGGVVFILIALILAIVAWFVYLYSSPHSTAEPPAPPASSTSAADLSADESAVSAVVVAFGDQEQNVDLLAQNATTSIADSYGPYVTPDLLATWESNPQSAPGRVVSSPWPDHIVVDSVVQKGTGYEVMGTLVLMSSAAKANNTNEGTDPVVLDLVNQGGKWLIESYEDLNAG